MSEYPNPCIHKRNKPVQEESHGSNCVPVNQLTQLPYLSEHRQLGPPDTNKINECITAERCLETRSDRFVIWTGGLIELVCEVNLLHIILGEKSNLHDNLVSIKKRCDTR